MSNDGDPREEEAVLSSVVAFSTPLKEVRKRHLSIFTFSSVII
jgi:hypothetical protein